MKFLFTIVTLFLLAEYSYALDRDEAKKMISVAVDTCAPTVKASEADIQKVKNCELVDTREGKCLAACTWKTTTFMTADNKLNKEIFMMGVQLMYGDNPGDAKKAEEIADECLNVTDADECEAAYKIGSCLKAGKEAKGLAFKYV